LFDSDDDGKLTLDDLKRVTTCMGFDFVSATELLSKYTIGPFGFTFDVFKNMVTDLANQFKQQEGRYYVLLSLEEAEHFRGVIHGRQGVPLLTTEATNMGGISGAGITTAALWVLADFSAFMLNGSTGFTPAPPAQHNSMVNSMRFMNSDVYFDDKSLTILLRVLEANSIEQREKWWTDVRACRRRRQVACDPTMSVVTVFNTVTEFQFMEFKAVVDRVQWALREKGMLVFDAYRAFNSSNTGLMTCSELYGGLSFLSIPFTPDQVYDLVRKLAISNEGLISYGEFRRVFQVSDEDLESRVLGGEANNFEFIPPKMITELAEQYSGKEEVIIKVTEDILQTFQVKVKKLTSLTSVWNSEGTLSHVQMSIWAPTTIRQLLTKSKARICLGHYVTPGFKDPLRSGDAMKIVTIEVTDSATIRYHRQKVVNAVLALLLPHPLRFKQIWHLARGDKSLYAWKPVVPEGFVAMGMICSLTNEPPDVTSMRCVPAAWCVASSVTPTKIWDDTGAGGGKPGSIWTVNSMDIVAIVAGHEPPKDVFYEFKSKSFSCEGMLNVANMKIT
jgi:Ca2+-binding EF-hand superfamily protein